MPISQRGSWLGPPPKIRIVTTAVIETRRFRCLWVEALYALCLALVAAAGAAFAAYALWEGAWGVTVVVIGVVAVVVLGAMHLARAFSVEIDSTTVTLRGMTTTRRVPLAEITAVATPVWRWHRVLALTCANGQQVVFPEMLPLGRHDPTAEAALFIARVLEQRRVDPPPSVH